ncbi:hypothetical protein P170DRAFT_442609 [Aspergillus steynii IBT 23096]|uniref:Uncharacterized protein n=1 Tax=Aspergillus steynii IBT 23096 TaxID=1392250 RepID=A0A2I2GNR3_9EURO|nr:uncharacterized protein P170DRAFT_442609 [Aspergillus steynii IBT 23096]PLB54515.1 hypothetical protein P170DRAFT_442609 [Aspergillus steynii IBT 23096]
MTSVASDASIRNLSGTWVMDKTRSFNVDGVLKLQGVGWITRRAVSAATAFLKITQGADAGDEWMIIEPSLSGVMNGGQETRPLTWAEFKHNDALFGLVIIRTHYIAGARVSDHQVRPLVELQTKNAGSNVETFLTEAVVIDQGVEYSGETVAKAFIHDFVRSVNSGWTAEQIWAVETVGDEKFLTRRVVVQKGTSSETAHVFYKRQ